MPEYGPGFAKPPGELGDRLAEGDVASKPSTGRGVALEAGGLLPGGVIRLAVMAEDPAAAFIQDGMVWIRSDTNQIRWREGGTTYQVTGTAV